MGFLNIFWGCFIQCFQIQINKKISRYNTLHEFVEKTSEIEMSTKFTSYNNIVNSYVKIVTLDKLKNILE